MTLKETLFSFCSDFVNERLTRIHARIAEVQGSLQSETKSTAGDKHETGRAMVQLEREKLGVQLAEAEKMQLLLGKVPYGDSQGKVGLGSLVKTDGASYFLAISAGALTASKPLVYCISPATPVGRLLMGKAVGDSLSFNGKTFRILEIS